MLVLGHAVRAQSHQAGVVSPGVNAGELSQIGSAVGLLPEAFVLEHARKPLGSPGRVGQVDLLDQLLLSQPLGRVGPTVSCFRVSADWNISKLEITGETFAIFAAFFDIASCLACEGFWALAHSRT